MWASCGDKLFEHDHMLRIIFLNTPEKSANDFKIWYSANTNSFSFKEFGIKTCTGFKEQLKHALEIITWVEKIPWLFQYFFNVFFLN